MLSAAVVPLLWLHLGYMASATHGSSIVFYRSIRSSGRSQAVQEYKATALYGVATMFLAELELLANGTVAHEGFQYLRTGIAAGSSVPAETDAQTSQDPQLGRAHYLLRDDRDLTRQSHDANQRPDPETHRHRRPLAATTSKRK